MPRPGRVLRLAQLLELSFDDLYGADVVAEPVVAFRKKAAARTRDGGGEWFVDDLESESSSKLEQDADKMASEALG